MSTIRPVYFIWHWTNWALGIGHWRTADSLTGKEFGFTCLHVVMGTHHIYNSCNGRVWGRTLELVMGWWVDAAPNTWDLRVSVLHVSSVVQMCLTFEPYRLYILDFYSIVSRACCDKGWVFAFCNIVGGAHHFCQSTTLSGPILKFSSRDSDSIDPQFISFVKIH